MTIITKLQLETMLRILIGGFVGIPANAVRLDITFGNLCMDEIDMVETLMSFEDTIESNFVLGHSDAATGADYEQAELWLGRTPAELIQLAAADLASKGRLETEEPTEGA